MLAKINWNPSSLDLRKFGLTLIIGFGLIGGLFFWFDRVELAKILWIVSGAIGALGIVLPTLAKPFYYIWMGIAFVMGTIVSFVIITVIYYFIITPVGLLMKLLRRDALKLKKKSFDGDTYWHTYSDIKDKNSYERLF